MGVTKLESAIGKVSNIDFSAKKEAEKNIKKPTKLIEKIALERSKICLSCKYIELEPIESERVIDSSIPELSNMMCGKCYCPLPKLLRQNKKKCKAKKW